MMQLRTRVVDLLSVAKLFEMIYQQMSDAFGQIIFAFASLRYLYNLWNKQSYRRQCGVALFSSLGASLIACGVMGYLVAPSWGLFNASAASGLAAVLSIFGMLPVSDYIFDALLFRRKYVNRLCLRCQKWDLQNRDIEVSNGAFLAWDEPCLNCQSKEFEYYRSRKDGQLELVELRVVGSRMKSYVERKHPKVVKKPNYYY